MCSLNCSRTFLSQMIQFNFIHGYTGVVRVSCLISKASQSTRFISRGYTCLSSQRHFPLHLSSTFQNGMGRYNFSDFPSENPRTRQDAYAMESESRHILGELQEKFNIDMLVSLLRQENAADICVIKVPEDIKYAEYFVVVSGSSTRHLRAMALYAMKVYKYTKNDAQPYVKIEGRDAEDWMCIDFGNMVVHFMLPETREVYELEKLWTLRSFDEKLSNIPEETFPDDFIYSADFNVTK
ncbi:hypothetical protein DPEC_G00140210 [Dallia pectoralis]|uniref:Uncharacterized protein n=1 Tax=Dallia pectoralis TaxID=75939 RepID=A0ACC2GM50_DALPE|nr:hypothetical protein DPEC_G00140210 [Dallia pectoralis]